MSSLRDVRFEKALAHAPDAADASPPAAVRAAIREAAHRAVAPAPRAGWWRRVFASKPGMPWNTAFASLLIAGVVTLLWRGGEEVPQEAAMAPRPPAVAEAPRADAGAPTPREAAPPLASAAPPAAKAAPSKPAPAAPVPAPQAAADAAARDVEAPKAAARQKQAADAAIAERREAERNTEPAPPAAASVAAPSAVPPAPAPAPAQAQEARVAARAAAPAAPLAGNVARRAETASAGTLQPPQRMPPWDTLRIEAPPRATVVPRAQAAAFTAALGELLAARGESVSPPRMDSPIQVLLLDETRTAAQLTLGEAAVTWQAAGEPATAWRPDAARLAALRGLALQLLQR